MVSQKKTRVTPNPQSRMLSKAVVGGAGIGFPPSMKPPAGMGAIVLYVPIEQIVGKSILEMQSDIGLPWSVEGGQPVWVDEL